MNFQQWVEVVETASVLNQIEQTFHHLLNGTWGTVHKDEYRPGWKMQNYYVIKLKGKDVVKSGDVFYAVVKTYVYKRPREEFQNLNIYSPPKWLDDPKGWYDAGQYDPKQGSPLVQFLVRVRGRRPDRRPLNPDADGYDQIGNSENGELKSPYEVAQFVKQIINDYYQDWDEDDDSSVFFEPEPDSSGLVGIR